MPSKIVNKFKDEFLDTITECIVDHDILSENKVNQMRARQMILSEQFTQGSTLPTGKRAPTKSNVGDRLKFRIGGTDGRIIDVNVFSGIWVNYVQYNTWQDIAYALGVDREEMKQNERKYREDLNRVAFYAYSIGLLDEYVSANERVKFYGEAQRAGMFDDDDPRSKPDFGDIYAGFSGNDSSRTGRFVDRMNDEELFSGEFYSNRTRIPKSRWGGWLRFWDREKTSVAKDQSLLGRSWKKLFIIGYQFERNTLFEIWYNSMDGTFTVHDHRGNPLSARMHTMSEQTKYLFQFILKHGDEKQDADVARSNNVATALSIQRSLSNDLENDSRLQQMKKLEKKQQAEFKREQDERQKRIDQIKARAAGATHATMRAASDKAMSQARRGASAARSAAERGAWAAHDAAQDTQDTFRQNRQKSKQQQRRFDNAMQDAVSGQENMRRQQDARNKDDFEQWMKSNKLSIPSIHDSLINDLPMIPEIIRLNESTDDDFFDDADAQANEIQQKFKSGEYQSNINQIRREAKNSPYTKNMLKSDAADLIEDYYETKSKRTFMAKLFGNIIRGRRDMTVLPTDFRPNKTFKSTLLGQRYIADFVIGFSINKALQYEVWYITEPNPDYKWKFYDLFAASTDNTTVSSYYVYDIRSQRIVRSYLPHYRHQVNQIMQKIAIF